jgi:hypothetical protein
MVFTEKALEDCLEEIEFDSNKLIKIRINEYEREHLKLFTGKDPGEYLQLNEITVLSPNYHKLIHERILEGKCLEITYTINPSLDSYIRDAKDVARIGMMFLEKLPKRLDISFFSEVFSNCIEWGGNDELDIHIRVTNKGSVTSITQKEEWDYKRYLEDFKKGIAKPKGGGAGMTVIEKSPYEVGYTNNGRTTYILITKK